MSRGLALRAAISFSVLACAGSALAADFTHKPPGKLEQKEVYGFYGNGYTDEKIFAPGLRFPIESAPAYANSQIFGIGGNGWDGNKPKQSSKGWKDPENYSYPWWDNYCEKRSWDMPMCPTGEGHQGQDIRPADSALDTHWVVAVVDGTVTNAYEAAADYLVEIVGADGTAYQYLHMSTCTVKDGAKVKKGDRIGKVGNKFYSNGASVPTTTHLHWQMKRNGIFIPVYTSLVSAYGSLLGVPTGSKYGAKFVSQSWAYSSAPAIALVEGESQEGFLELENTGTEIWKKGVVKLAPTPRDKTSAFAAPSWLKSDRVSTVDKDVKPGEKYKFPLDLAGNIVGPEAKQTFGLVAEGIAWFSDPAPAGGGPPDDQLEIKAIVTAATPGSGGKAGAAGSPGKAGSSGASGETGTAGKPGAAAGVGGSSSGSGGSAGSSSGAAGKAGASASNGGSGGSVTAGAGGSPAAGGKGGAPGAAGKPSSGSAGKSGKPSTEEEAAAPVSPTAEDGCGCRTAGSPASSGALLFCFGVVSLFTRRRRLSVKG